MRIELEKGSSGERKNSQVMPFFFLTPQSSTLNFLFVLLLMQSDSFIRGKKLMNEFFSVIPLMGNKYRVSLFFKISFHSTKCSVSLCEQIQAKVYSQYCCCPSREASIPKHKSSKRHSLVFLCSPLAFFHIYLKVFCSFQTLFRYNGGHREVWRHTVYTRFPRMIKSPRKLIEFSCATLFLYSRAKMGFSHLSPHLP